MPDQLKDHRIWHAQHQPIEERQYQQMIKTWGDRFK
jgi:putative ATPase